MPSELHGATEAREGRVLTDALLRGEVPEPDLYGAERAALAASMATLQRQASIGIFYWHIRTSREAQLHMSSVLDA